MPFKEVSGLRSFNLFTYLVVVNAAVTPRVAQDRLIGTVGQSVLLPVSYTDSDLRGYLRITWTKAGSRIADVRCPSGRNGNFAECHQTIFIADHYKHRAVLFPENASLLLRDLQISDSGIYELSIGHSTGTEKGSFSLTVQPGTGYRIAGVTLRVHQDRVNGTAGHSVLFPASYTDSHGYLRIKWTRAGIRIAAYRCPSDRNGSFAGCNHVLTVPDDYKHRAVLFPENASLLLKDLQVNDSGVYELSISQPTGTETGSFNLTVQPDIKDTDKEQASGVGMKVRYGSLVVYFIFICLIVKSHRGCKQTQAKCCSREKQKAPRDQSGKICGKNLSPNNPTVVN